MIIQNLDSQDRGHKCCMGVCVITRQRSQGRCCMGVCINKNIRQMCAQQELCDHVHVHGHSMISRLGRGNFPQKQPQQLYAVWVIIIMGRQLQVYTRKMRLRRVLFPNGPIFPTVA